MNKKKLEDEAKALYPDEGSVEARIAADYSLNDVRKSERSAHITCAGMYTGEIDKLKAENSKMRLALEWYADAGNYLGDNGELATAWKQNENIKNKAAEAIKSPNV